MIFVEFQRICAWSGVICMLLFCIGLLCAQFIPVPPPSLKPEQVVAMYQGNTNGIRIGMLFVLVGSLFMQCL